MREYVKICLFSLLIEWYFIINMCQYILNWTLAWLFWKEAVWSNLGSCGGHCCSVQTWCDINQNHSYSKKVMVQGILAHTRNQRLEQAPGQPGSMKQWRQSASMRSRASGCFMYPVSTVCQPLKFCGPKPFLFDLGQKWRATATKTGRGLVRESSQWTETNK